MASEKVKGHGNLVRDNRTGAILNIDKQGLIRARNKKRIAREQKDELISLRKDLQEIKELLLNKDK